ncbi:hypothetical protein PN36_15000 [Candidatus Thiomargarita nelsonii]|uniref:Uncharacterized protein n=1 Tax=Candidatus Thiomargarita nelsonii TaxID=1003181 RepID=A0A0A6PDG2_9GAMM|nr:hypothetical protein PN36_15000 [Candidatus Thiomargarita nelsonii]
MYYKEYEKHDLPETLVSQLDYTRVQLELEGRNSDTFRTLGNIDTAVTDIPACLSPEALQELLDKNEHRLRADDDARAFFRYDLWVSEDRENQNILQNEISRFMPGASPSGFFWYPNGSHMGWHTNANRPGERLFCTYVKEGGKSFFRYRHPDTGKIYTCWEKEGWNFRIFLVGNRAENYLWHCVYAAVERMSFGFYLPLELMKHD